MSLMCLLVEGGVGEFVHLRATGTPWVVGGGCADLSLDICVALGEVFTSSRRRCMNGINKRLIKCDKGSVD